MEIDPIKRLADDPADRLAELVHVGCQNLIEEITKEIDREVVYEAVLNGVSRLLVDSVASAAHSGGRDLSLDEFNEMQFQLLSIMKSYLPTGSTHLEKRTVWTEET